MHTSSDNMELAAPNMFETAFKMLTPMYLRFCNSPILPVDFSVGSKKLLDQLKKLKEESRNVIALDDVIEKANEFCIAYKELYEIGKILLDSFKKNPKEKEFKEDFNMINDALIRINKNINRVLMSGLLKWDKYSVGLYFNALDATEIQSIPVLLPLKQLIKLNPGTDEYGSLYTKLTRERNKVFDELSDAIEIAKRVKLPKSLYC